MSVSVAQLRFLLALMVLQFTFNLNSLVDAAESTASQDSPRAGTITVHVDQPTVELPETLYGLFYEDINYSADGGLYAELVQNRSFEYYPVEGWNRRSQTMQPLTAWEKVCDKNEDCSLAVESSDPLNDVNMNYLRLTITKPGDGVGVANLGYDGISVKEGETYEFSVYAKRTTDNQLPLHVRLEGEQGEIASAQIDTLSKEWTKYEVPMTARRSDAKGRLVLLTGGTGDVMMDMVSLFPRNTFNERKNGLRADLVQALVDLKPAVFRFPGGCIAHGQGLDNAYRWKDTIGDVAERKPNWNLWGYHQSYGLGYYEYFLLCEDIGAEPLPILPVGVSCGFRQPFQNALMDQLQPWIDDAVDLVEFANGPVDSHWGSIRASMGHPKPFGLKYVGLGNEDHHTPEFEERFPHFVRALREQAPEVKIVGTSGLGPEIPIYEFMSAQGCDLSDEHYYESPEWFIANAHRFDNFDRSKTKVFVGEYASRGNQLYNAVAEAVYLTGIERNADLVQMTAYAPLFARYDYTQWTAADLIWFNHDTVVRTPNYYVQQLFSVNKGDKYLKNESEFDAALSSESLPSVGHVGVGTWDTTAVFDHIQVKVGDDVVIKDGFTDEDTDNGWQVLSGAFARGNEGYAQSDQAAKPSLTIHETPIETPEAVLTLRAKKVAGREGFLIVFGHKASQTNYWWNLGGWGNTQHGIEKGSADGEGGRSLVVGKAGRIRTNVWYDIRVELDSNHIRCYLDDALIHDVTLETPNVAVAASHDDDANCIVLKLANPTNETYRTSIKLEGAGTIAATATLFELAGDRVDMNDLENPHHIKPVKREILVSDEFEHMIPPMSVQFVRIPHQ
ncbi:Extracellular exo-alpha-L-arabinofuranosidase precursor [Planctomycetes bacterium CA13]|uniref:non-reducing end alpha-L-arabinofuranosidase n=1 Tax=Novipirellula herctigrandis TaxID=2527986 RepID=A0A5C5ZDB1_9BACT|nr:Extracellular exo-alpha-L-arabinofuranosidase precursor [Planctomycetes bacterium CA13]